MGREGEERELSHLFLLSYFQFQDRAASHHVYIFAHTYSPKFLFVLGQGTWEYPLGLNNYSLESVNLLPGAASALALAGLA